MQILDGRIVASTILENIKKEITYSQDHQKPMLAVVLVGDNPASLSYIRMKEKRAREVGMNFGLYRYDSSISQTELKEKVQSLSDNDQIHGIIVQSPLPSHIDPYSVIECIDPSKDVDGFTKTQIGNVFLGHTGLASCTPKGIMTMLKHYHINVEGKNVVIIGRSNIVGKPLALIMINAGATVTSCNSKTQNLESLAKKADILIAAIGKPGFITQNMTHPDQVIIDVGCTFVDGIARGDTDFDNIKDSVRAISPVPGGVGPMTVATLIENTWKAFEAKKRDN